MIAVSVDLQRQFGSARDQGPRPTCLAFAASDAHAAKRSAWSPLSCEFAFFHAQRRAKQPPTSGASLASMLEAIRQDGQPVESRWPYLPATPPNLATWKPPVRCGPLFHRSGATSHPAVAEIIAALNTGQPVIVMMVPST